MRETVLTDIVERITIRQLGASQGLELCRISMQFQFGRDHLVHSSSIADVHTNIKCIVSVNTWLCALSLAPFLPIAKARELLARSVDITGRRCLSYKPIRYLSIRIAVSLSLSACNSMFSIRGLPLYWILYTRSAFNAVLSISIFCSSNTLDALI